MTDTLRSGQVTSDTGEIKSNYHQTQLQTLYHLQTEDSADHDLRMYTQQEQRLGSRRPRFCPSSTTTPCLTSGKTPSLSGSPVSSSGKWGLNKDH